MLFASTALGARIERAEGSLISDSARAIARNRGAEVFVQPIAGGVAVLTEEESPLNKLVGLGFDGPVDEAELELVERTFAARGAALRAEVACLAEPSVCELLTRRGYALIGFENVLGRALPAEHLPAIPAGIEITPGGPDDFAAWLDVVVTGFATPDTQGVPSHESYPREVIERVVGDMATAEGFVRYLARRAGSPVGGASMRLHAGVAQLCGAATLPAHRRRGVQGAFLARRLAEASAAGCDVAVMTTQPGSKSQENGQRKGFELLYARAILERA